MVRSKRPLSLTTPVAGLEFICFSVPELEHTPFDIKFNEEYTSIDTFDKSFIDSSISVKVSDPAFCSIVDIVGRPSILMSVLTEDTPSSNVSPNNNILATEKHVWI
jgi:hypothetical protein